MIGNIWRSGEPESVDGPFFESIKNGLWLDAKFAGLPKIITATSYHGVLDLLSVYHRQELLDFLLNGFRGSKIGFVGTGVGVVGVGLRSELLHLGRHIVNGDCFQRDVVQPPSDKASFPRKENQVTPSRSPCATSSADAVNIVFRRGWDTDLDDSRHSWVIYTSSRNIAGH